MTPQDRIRIIRRCGHELASLRSYAEVDAILQQVDISTPYHWDSDYDQYVLQHLTGARDVQLRQLEDALFATISADPSLQPWTVGFRLFLSHVSAEKVFASGVKMALTYYGIDGFVAHEDIEPTKPWLQVVEAALQSCDALAALLHPGFHQSNWCDQEVGYCLGRNRLVLNVRLGVDPYGFIGQTQALTPTGDVHQLAKRIAELLIDHPSTAEAMTDALVSRVRRSQSYNMTNQLLAILCKHPAHVTRQHTDLLREGQRANEEISGAFDAESHISALESRLPPVVVPMQVPTYDYDAEPF